MSDPALAPLIAIDAAVPRGMITVKGDLGDPGLRAALSEATGQAMPDTGAARCADESGLLWMAPDEVLVLTPAAEAADTAARLAAALAGAHALVADVSDARVLFRLSGPALRDVLAKLTPADLRPAALPPGRVRRTRFAQVPAAFWLTGPTTAELICFRSVSRYMRDLLKAAATPGSGPDYF